MWMTARSYPLIGANGAGKTTTLRTITGLEKAASGSVMFDGHDLRKAEPSKIITYKLAHVPEGRHIFPQMTVEENLEMGAYADPAGMEETMKDVYKRFPRLEERRRQLAGTLSGGEQQMLAVGRALMAKPKMILMDEPSMGLSPLLVKEIFAIIQEVNKQGHHDPAGGTERKDGAGHLGPRLCAGNRQHQH